MAQTDSLPRVINAYKVTRPESDSAAPDTTKDLKLEDELTVEVENLPTLLKMGKAQKKSIVLFLDDRPLKDVKIYPLGDSSNRKLRFQLAISEDAEARQVWTYILGKPSWTPRKTTVSVGLVDSFALPSNAAINFNVIPHGWFTIWSFLFILLVVGFFLIGDKSELLRDSVPQPGGGQRRPFSLARTQIAFWFFIILASYLFIGMITGNFSSSITGSVLVLLGISSATAVGSAVIDANKNNSTETQKQLVSAKDTLNEIGQLDLAIQSLKNDDTGLTENIQTINSQLPTLKADLETLKREAEQDSTNAVKSQSVKAKQDEIDSNEKDLLEKQTSLVAKQAELAIKQTEKEEKVSLLRKLTNQSENFLIDILSDINGVSFHRFQMAAWTLILGIIFIVQVYKVLAMPVFNETLLTLLGISAGTYLSLKIPETATPKP
ncbi:kinetochore Spc7 family protein [Spirosoma endbachense]|uniref:Uncharacterized protein n=1 Tax=Spirosoma endbachense TaxID=2666025 RepID=A0A6P1VXJ7_9BACT|nr:hypothetical protein [Spirosoma endbachense]QHV96429.1 hypothetical protein GJR95_15990 [Spirosoma endbachense]